MSSSSTYFSSSPLQKRVSVMVRWGEGGGEVVMVVLSGILKFHLYTLLDFSTIRGKCNSIYVHGSQTSKLSNSCQ